MKKGLVIPLILLLLPSISALFVEIKDSYGQGETILAKVSGDFYKPLEENNVYFYRGHVKIPMDYDVGRVGDYYYIRASTSGKSPGNYSIKIKNFYYYQEGHLTDAEMTKEFFILDSIADFSIDPAFIVSAGGFSVELRNLQATSISLSITSPSGITSLSSIDLSPRQIKEVDFDTSKVQQTLLSVIQISSPNLGYEIPIYVNFDSLPLGPYCGDGKVDAGEQCDNQEWGVILDCSYFGFNAGTLSCNPPSTSGECNFDLRNCFTSTSNECDNTHPCNQDQVCIGGICITLEPEQECDIGETKCNNAIYYICENEVWLSQGKVVDNCGVECLLGDKCISQEYYSCEDNQWKSQGLVDGKCGYESEPGECSIGELKCNNAIYYICENEVWVSQGLVDGKCGYESEPEPEIEESYCGNRLIEVGEQCDTYRWGEIAGCRSFGFEEGILDCIDCVFDTSLCHNQMPPFGCIYNSDCGSGYYCSADEECVAEEIKRCSSEQDCSEGEICYRGICIKIQECNYNKDCRISYECSEEGKCVKIDYECREDRDCGKDEECDGGYCVEKEKKECKYDRDCKKGYECGDNNKCVELPECREDRDCGKDEECDDKKCIKKEGDECSPNKACDQGYKCEGGYCKIDPDVECITYRECKADYTCINNECILRATSKTCDELGGDLCTANEVCVGAYQKVNEYICCLDTQCTPKPGGSTGKIIGWVLIGVVALALLYFFFKYKGAKNKKPLLKGAGLNR